MAEHLCADAIRSLERVEESLDRLRPGRDLSGLDAGDRRLAEAGSLRQLRRRQTLRDPQLA
jgi:hypothetical protein